MRKLALTLTCAAALALAGCSNSRPFDLEKCDNGHTAIGAGAGAVVGTLIFPVVGTIAGAAVGAGGTCAVEHGPK